MSIDLVAIFEELEVVGFWYFERHDDRGLGGRREIDTATD